MFHKYKRIFVIVADSVGIGAEPDADKFFNAGHNDVGSNTIVHLSEKMPNGLHIPEMNSWGINDLDPNIVGTSKVDHPHAYVAKAREKSNGKDTMTGHWEMMGVYTTKPFMTFTDTGFPKELMDELEKRTGHKCIGNYASSGTEPRLKKKPTANACSNSSWTPRSVRHMWSSISKCAKDTPRFISATRSPACPAKCRMDIMRSCRCPRRVKRCISPPANSISA